MAGGRVSQTCSERLHANCMVMVGGGLVCTYDGDSVSGLFGLRARLCARIDVDASAPAARAVGRHILGLLAL